MYLVALLRRIDVELLGNPDLGQTTAVIAVIGQHRVLGAAVGDSAAWLIGRQNDTVLTPTSMPFLGTGEAHPVTFGSRLHGHTLVLATDGLFRYVEAGEIVEAALHEDIRRAASQLVNLPRQENGMPPDDVAVVAVRQSEPATTTDFGSLRFLRRLPRPIRKLLSSCFPQRAG